MAFDDLKAFFKKKKANVKFAGAGPGHTLNESRAANAQRSQPVTTQPKSSASTSGGSQSDAARAAREAALKRLEQSEKSNTGKTRRNDPLCKILEEEKQKVLAQHKVEDERLSSRAQSAQQEAPKTVATYSCPALGIETFSPIPDIWRQMEEQIVANFGEEPLVSSSLVLKSCNDCDQASQAIALLEKIVSNIGTASEEDRQKFKRIRKLKIENKILACRGGLQFLNAIGFVLDDENEWFNLVEDDGVFISKIDTIIAILRDDEKFQLEFNRTVNIYPVGEGASASGSVDDDFYKLNVSDLKAEQQKLSEDREREETLMTKKMRDQLYKKSDSPYTRIRVRKEDMIYEVTFKSCETLSVVVDWFTANSIIDSFTAFDICFGRDIIATDNYSKSLSELGMSPAASLIFKVRQ